MVRFRSLTVGVLVVGLLATAVAFAQGPRRGGPGGGRGMLGAAGPGRGSGLALGALDLSEAQREQVREITRRYREQNQAVEKRLGDAMEKQRAAIEAVPANEALITSLTQDLVQAQVDLAIQQARLNTEIWSVLTPEQQAQATKNRADRQTRMEERRKEMEQRRAR